jgi:hypothetical protein
MDPMKSQAQSESELIDVPMTRDDRRSTIRFRKTPKPKKTAPATLEYPSVRKDIQTGDVFLYKGKGFWTPAVGWISPVVRWFTNSPYTHAGMAVWWDKRLMVIESIGRGVIANPVSLSFDRYKADIDWFTSREEISSKDRDKMEFYSQEQLGKRFAFWKAFLLLVKMKMGLSLDRSDRFRKESRFYCSQFVAQVYNKLGFDLSEGRADRFMSPKDVAESPLLRNKGRIRK